ncbi:short-chain dehydrogenase/reductase SDR [Truepera radiovictrix DSM 17093]|uniref:Short-chain dehydrogenase/reductase SDR n=1 Tax=Truepera radiovictrix (strain DSM 17093 / CIP 108686 / LMG 22925 / RQ-24) TaxID=649638 RepID=D7CUG1_TRURR|nr:short-chain dehydrogenase/reductase SDR [Truepera radiovictrix DSM 17093]
MLVTGASSGIGRETARALARAGATVLTVSRPSGEGEALAAQLRQTGAEVHFFPADLSSLAEVRRVARALRARAPRLDVLVNNAGAFFSERQTTAEGLERTLALNHLSVFLLTHLLLEPLLASPAARVVTVSSQAERLGRVHWDDPMLRRGYNGWKAYSQSKLGNLLFSYELARRLAGTAVSVNALHPGGVATGFGSGNRGVGALLLKLARPLFKSPEEGAKTVIYLAASPEVAGISGRYFADCRPASSSWRSRDPELQARFWRLSEALVGLGDEEAAALRRVSQAAGAAR